MGTRMFQVIQISGTSPQTAASNALIFATNAEAEAYAASQYTAQTADPFYPFTWWAVQEITLEDGFDYISGYPAPGPAGSVPSAPLDVSATTDGTHFTVSWTPNSPSSPEYYTINFNAPLYEAESSDSWTVGGTAITSLYNGYFNNNFSSTVNSNSITFSGGVWAQTTSYDGYQNVYLWENYGTTGPYCTDLTFNVYATNAYGSGPSSAISETSVIAYGPNGGVPAIPTDMSLTLTTSAVTVQSGVTYNTYTLAWNQAYPTGAGIPTSWIAIGVENLQSYMIGNTFTIATSGTPATGNLLFTASSSQVSSSDNSIVLYANNANGRSNFAFNNI